MCENLHYESVYFKELHNEHYRAEAAVLLSDAVIGGVKENFIIASSFQD